jgi:hypothetical protein
LFRPDSRVAESGERRRIDRLVEFVVEFDDAVWALDYETGDAADTESGRCAG